MANSIFTISPYMCYGTWVFDDEHRGLQREALVSGIPEMLNDLLHKQGIDALNEKFSLVFSEFKFPDFQVVLSHDGNDGYGDWYLDESTGMRGWLCPALRLYFPDKAPESLYIKVNKVMA